MSKHKFEIYFSDLTPAAQQEYLKFIGETDIAHIDCDAVPIAAIEQPDAELQTIKLYSPLRITIDRGEYWRNDDCDLDGDFPELSAYDAVQFKKEIAAFFVKELSADKDEIEYGLMAYYHENDSVKDKVKRIGVSVETVNDRLMGVATLSVYEPLNASELQRVKRYLSGQYSDGFGEGAEQRPVDVFKGDLYVSLWQSGPDFSIRTEEEMLTKPRNRGDAR